MLVELFAFFLWEDKPAYSCVSSVPWQLKGPTLFWCASSTAQLAAQGRRLSHSVLHMCGPTSSILYGLGHLGAST